MSYLLEELQNSLEAIQIAFYFNLYSRHLLSFNVDKIVWLVSLFKSPISEDRNLNWHTDFHLPTPEYNWGACWRAPAAAVVGLGTVPSTAGGGPQAANSQPVRRGYKSTIRKRSQQKIMLFSSAKISPLPFFSLQNIR